MLTLEDACESTTTAAAASGSGCALIARSASIECESQGTFARVGISRSPSFCSARADCLPTVLYPKSRVALSFSRLRRAFASEISTGNRSLLNAKHEIQAELPRIFLVEFARVVEQRASEG